MKATDTRTYTWDQTEAAEEWIATAEQRKTDHKTMRDIARLAENTDEANAIWDLITDLRRQPVR